MSANEAREPAERGRLNESLPDGWALSTVGSVTEKVSNVSPERSPEREFGYVDISSVSNTTYSIEEPKRFKGKDAPSRARRPIQPGDVLFSNVRTYLRNIALVPRNTDAQLCSTGFTVLRTNGAVDPRYLFYYVLTDDFIDLVTPRQTGTHYPATSDRVVMDSPLPLPPVAEQMRIVAKLEELLVRVKSACQHLDRWPAIHRRLREAVLAAACSGSLTTDWRGATIRDDTESGLPESWELLNLGELACSIRGGSTEVPVRSKTAYPILRSSSVRPFVVDYEDVRYLTARQSEHDDYILQEGDLLITRLSGSIDYVGNCALVRSLNGRLIQYPDRLFCCRLKNPAEAPFLEVFLAGPSIRRQIERASRSAAGHQRISISDLLGFTIARPPIEEQREIVQRVKDLFALTNEIEAHFEKADRQAKKLMSSILAKAFRGELVATEAELARLEGRDYERAVALLERIQGERSTNPPRRQTGEKPQKRTSAASLR